MAQPIKVVLVEDNDVFRETLELLLGLRSDVEVVAALADGRRATDACRELGVDVVLLDYRLPGLDGLEVARALRRECPDVAVVCLTATAGDRDVEELRKIGVAATIKKDEQLDEIVATLQRAAGRLVA